MAKDKKPSYKAVNPEIFKDSYSESAPGYKALSEGKEASLSLGDKMVKNWLLNNIIEEV